MIILIIAAAGVAFILWLIGSIVQSKGAFRRAKTSKGGGGWIVALILAAAIILLAYAAGTTTNPDVRQVIHGR